MEPVLIMKTASVLLAITALGGLTMALIVGHASVAVAGFALLLVATWMAIRS